MQLFSCFYTGLDARKPDFVACEQQRSIPAQSDQCLCFTLPAKYVI